MRTLPADIAAKIASPVQTPANNADPSLDLWISRPATPITDNHFLERQIAVSGAYPTTADVAVRHPRAGRQSDRIYIAYISDGTAKIVSAQFREAVEAHIWQDSGFSESAVDVAIAFDGTMPKTIRGDIEFVTEKTPWIFWVTAGGKLYAEQLNSNRIREELASSGCTAVTAIRATQSGAGNFDFGLVVFFILNGSIYYRQLIGGEWYDAELVTGLPSATWVDIAASRTWDYRTVIQAQDSAGNVYELYSQYQGIGKQLTEHIEIANISAVGNLIPIRYYDAKTDEHINIANITAGALYGGLYATGAPSIVDAYNVDDGTGDWGKKCVFVFDKHLVAADVAAQNGTFSITDTRNGIFTASGAELQSDGKTVILTFPNFNNADGECYATYTPGTVKSMAGDTLTGTTYSFTPEHLVPSTTPAPEVDEIWNLDADGEQIAIRFTQPLIGDVIGNEDAFTISFDEYNYVPGGTTATVTRTLDSVTAGDTADVIILTLPSGNVNSIQNAAGDVTVSYAGGTLAGEGGAVEQFELDFTPEDLIFKGDQNDAEHIEISNISATGTLMHIYYTDTKTDEHIEIANITATGTLTNIHDI